MATRDAAIRLTLEDSAFSSGIKRAGRDVMNVARSMGSTLKHELGEGMHAGIHGVQHLGHEIKHILGLALPIAGGLGFAEMAHHALDAQVTADRVAMKLRAVGDAHATTEHALHAAHQAADQFNMTIEESIGSYERLLDKTGSPVFSEEALSSVSLLMRAFRSTHQSASDVVAMLNKGFGASTEQIQNEYAPALQGTLTRAAITMDQLGAHAQEMGALAYRSGMQGVDGLKEMIGLLGVAKDKASDAEIRFNGLKLVFDKLGTKAAVKTLGKELGIDTTALMNMNTPMERLRALLGSKKGLNALEELFKRGNLKDFFEGMVAPIKAAHDEVGRRHGLAPGAIPTGAIAKEADLAGMQAFENALAGAAESTKTKADVEMEAAIYDKLAQRQLTVAMDKMARSFENPKFLDAMNRLTAIMPELADAFSKFLDFVLNHPIAGGAAVVGGQFALSAGMGVAGGLLGAAGKAALGAIGLGHGVHEAVEHAAEAVGEAAAGEGGLMGAGSSGARMLSLGGEAAPAAGGGLAGGALLSAGSLGLVAGLIAKLNLDYLGEKGVESERSKQTARTDAEVALMGTNKDKQRKALKELELVEAASRATSAMASGDIGGGAAAVGGEFDALKERLRRQIDSTEAVASANERLARSLANSSRGVNPPAAAKPGSEPAHPGE